MKSGLRGEPEADSSASSLNVSSVSHVGCSYPITRFFGTCEGLASALRRMATTRSVSWTAAVAHRFFDSSRIASLCMPSVTEMPRSPSLRTTAISTSWWARLLGSVTPCIRRRITSTRCSIRRGHVYEFSSGRRCRFGGERRISLSSRSWHGRRPGRARPKGCAGARGRGSAVPSASAGCAEPRAIWRLASAPRRAMSSGVSCRAAGGQRYLLV